LPSRMLPVSCARREATMSDTPRTDAQSWYFVELTGENEVVTGELETVDVEFARTLERELAEKDAKIAEQARELSLCREWRDAVQGIAVDAGVVITGDPIEDVRLAIEFRDTAIAEQAEEIERLRKEEGGEE